MYINSEKKLSSFVKLVFEQSHCIGFVLHIFSSNNEACMHAVIDYMSIYNDMSVINSSDSSNLVSDASLATEKYKNQTSNTC